MFVILYVFAFFSPIYINKYIIPSSEYTLRDWEWQKPQVMKRSNTKPGAASDLHFILAVEGTQFAVILEGFYLSVSSGGVLNYWFINQFWDFPHKNWI